MPSREAQVRSSDTANGHGSPQVGMAAAHERSAPGGGRLPLPYPNGWFAACFSHELEPGAVLTVPFLGQELVLYRTRSGLARAIDPYCPHLGAHLGHGGAVEGEELICPFHGLAFGSDGRCVRASTGAKPPLAALARRDVREMHGFVLVWRDGENRPPSWEVPECDLSDFSRLHESSRVLHGYAQDFAENAADSSHFAWLHGFEDVAMSSRAEGIRLEHTITAHWKGMPIRMRLTSYGVGYALGESELPGFGVQVRSLAFGTQTAPLEWTFRWADALRVARLDAWPKRLREVVYAAVVPLAHRWSSTLVRADFPIWNNRAYIQHPKLMSGESSMAAFRRWSAQFYPAPARGVASLGVEAALRADG